MTHTVQSFLDQPLNASETRALRALWHAAHNCWDQAHDEAQDGSDAECAWVHALLHREEGDLVNAAYWYRRAGKPLYKGTIQQEREDMIDRLLQSRV